MADTLPYRYAWNRCGRKGQLCRVAARGTMNSALVIFADGFGMVTSRNALRRADALARPRTAEGGIGQDIAGGQDADRHDPSQGQLAGR